MRIDFTNKNRVSVHVYQYDYGQVLEITGINLPDEFEMHFQNGTGQAEPVKGRFSNGVGTVSIPDDALQQDTDCFDAWLYVEDENSGKTVKTVTFNVEHREISSGIPPLSSVSEIKSYADYVKENADKIDLAAEAANKAESSSEKADAAAEKANKAAADADVSAGNADTAAENADMAAQSAQTAADNANTAAQNVQSAADNADNAAKNAQNAISNTNAAAKNAQDAAANANTAVQNIQNSTANANTAAQSANDAAANANISAESANSAASKANAAAEGADTAANSANGAAQNAQGITDTLNAKLENGEFDGRDGDTGLSAYEVAVANGFSGTEAQWLASLKSTLDYNDLENKPTWELVFEKTYEEDTTGTITWALSKPCSSIVIKVVSVGTAQNTKDWITGVYPQDAGSQQFVNCLKLHTDPESSYVGLARLDYIDRMIYSSSQYSNLISGIPNINTRFESSGVITNPNNFVYVVAGDKGALTQLRVFLDTALGTRYIGAGSIVKIWGC